MDASAAALVKAAAAVQQRSSTSSGSSSNTSLTSQSLDNQSNVPATASALLLRLSQLRAKKEAARREQEAKVREALARIKRAGTDFTSGPSNGMYLIIYIHIKRPSHLIIQQQSAILIYR